MRPFKTFNVSLTPDFAALIFEIHAFVVNRITPGRFQNTREVVRTAPRLLTRGGRAAIEEIHRSSNDHDALDTLSLSATRTEISVPPRRAPSAYT